MALIIILIFASLLLLARFVLPLAVLSIVNKKLKALPHHTGHIKNISIRLIKGTITFHDIVIENRNAPSRVALPFFYAPKVLVDFQWKALIKKSFLADIYLDEPQIDYEKAPQQIKESNKRSKNFKSMVEGMRPFDIDLHINKGKVRFKDDQGKSPVHMELSDIQCTVLHLSNHAVQQDLLPTQMKLQGKVYEGTLDLSLKLNLLAEKLTFDMNTQIKDMNLVCLNSLLKAHAHIDVNSGKFEMYTEVAAREGEFKGYIKPIFTELDLLGAEDKNDNLLTRLWEGFVALSIQVLKNKTSDQVAAKISISGKLQDPHINIFSAISTILKNGFVQALRPSVEDVINVDQVKKTFRKSKRFLRKLYS